MQASTKRKWIYFRYFLPIIALFLTFLLLFIPCYSYTTVDWGNHETVSLWTLMDNSWKTVCKNLFDGVGSQDHATTAFSQTVLTVLVGFVLLFLVAITATVYHLVGVLRYFRDPEDVGRGRILFVTLMPNRAVPLLMYALAIPMFTFPHLLPIFYESIYNYYITMSLTFVDPIILVAVLYGIVIVSTIATASAETGLGMNPYRRRRVDDVDEDEDDELDEYDE